MLLPAGAEFAHSGRDLVSWATWTQQWVGWDRSEEEQRTLYIEGNPGSTTFFPLNSLRVDKCLHNVPPSDSAVSLRRANRGRVVLRPDGHPGVGRRPSVSRGNCFSSYSIVSVLCELFWRNVCVAVCVCVMRTDGKRPRSHHRTTLDAEPSRSSRRHPLFRARRRRVFLAASRRLLAASRPRLRPSCMLACLLACSLACAGLRLSNLRPRRFALAGIVCHLPVVDRRQSPRKCESLSIECSNPFHRRPSAEG